MPLSQGQVLNNRYRIVRLLGQGGFGAVYKAWDLQMAGACALKENLETSPEAQEQFVREAQLLYKLKHPNLPRALDHFTIAGQGQYLVMDYIEGENLKDIVGLKGALPLDQALEWIGQICDALTYLHSRQPPVIHRDIKPANIKITPEGNAVLVDFGIAKLYDPAAGTRTGARAYTPGYAPPEQHSGKLTDVQSDLYSLGATAWTLLTGMEPPDTNDILAGLSAPTPPARQVNPLVSAVVSQAVEARHAAQAVRPTRQRGRIQSCPVCHTCFTTCHAAHRGRPAARARVPRAGCAARPTHCRSVCWGGSETRPNAIGAANHAARCRSWEEIQPRLAGLGDWAGGFAGRGFYHRQLCARLH